MKLRFVKLLENLLKKKYNNNINQAAPTINDYVETATFPTEIVEALKPLKLIHKTDTYVKTGLAYLELAKVDAGLATFYLLWYYL